LVHLEGDPHTPTWELNRKPTQYAVGCRGRRSGPIPHPDAAGGGRL
jgi:hypothetical protein